MAAPRGFVPSSRAERGTRLGGATVPGQYTILIRVTPPNGYHWHVISEGKTLARGEAASDSEARAAADDAIKLLERPDPPSVA